MHLFVPRHRLTMMRGFWVIQLGFQYHLSHFFSMLVCGLSFFFVASMMFIHRGMIYDPFKSFFIMPFFVYSGPDIPRIGLHSVFFPMVIYPSNGGGVLESSFFHSKNFTPVQGWSCNSEYFCLRFPSRFRSHFSCFQKIVKSINREFCGFAN